MDGHAGNPDGKGESMTVSGLGGCHEARHKSHYPGIFPVR